MSDLAGVQTSWQSLPMTKLLTPDELRKLPVEDRLQMIADIWDSLDGEADDLPLPDWQRDELNRRLDALEQDPDAGRPWPEVRADILARLPRK